MNKFSELKALVESAEADFEKFFDKENNAAGTRVRKALQEIGVFCKNTRKEVTDVKNARKAAK